MRIVSEIRHHCAGGEAEAASHGNRSGCVDANFMKTIITIDMCLWLRGMKAKIRAVHVYTLGKTMRKIFPHEHEGWYHLPPEGFYPRGFSFGEKIKSETF